MADALKDMFHRTFVSDLAEALRRQCPAFDVEAFCGCVINNQWSTLELKQRMRHITTIVHDFLPADYRAALAILRRAAPLLDEYGFQNMVLSDYVSFYGLDDWEASIPALEQFTQQVSAEFAVRPFVVRDRDRMMVQMVRWAQHEDARVRRLATEGSRPRLPWGSALPALQADPTSILPILEQLKLDSSEDVRRSVANNLNDISKDHPDLVIDVLRRWRAHDTKEMRSLTSHALRTLLKAGHPNALELLGYPANPAVTLRNLTVTPNTIPMGGCVTLSFDIESLGDAPQKLMIDYVVYLMRANGKQTPKVLKLTKRTIQPGEALSISKRIDFRPVTTRRYYPGAHGVSPKVNGRVLGRVEFLLAQGEPQ